MLLNGSPWDLLPSAPSPHLSISMNMWTHITALQLAGGNLLVANTEQQALMWSVAFA